MKLAVTIFAISTLLGCSQQNAQSSLTAPSPVPSSDLQAPADRPLANVWAVVVDQTGVCIAGATVQIVRGPAVGQIITQTGPCDAWWYDDGIFFKGLTPGLEITLRASAPGYAPQEKTIVPSPGSQMTVVFAPSRQ